MGKLKKFTVELLGDGRYTPGETLNGHVELDLCEPMEVKRLTLRLLGKADLVGKVRIVWRKENGKMVKHCLTEEVYFDNQRVLSGSETGKPLSTLPSGTSRFPFSFTLPADIPSSYDGKEARVVYVAEATIEKSWAFDESVVRNFTVNGVVDLNDPAFTEFRSPVTVDASDEKQSKDHVTARVTVNKRCFVPGETVDLSAHIFNAGGSKINKVWASLEQCVAVRMVDFKWRPTQIYTIVKQDANNPVTEGNLSCVQLVVPKIIPSKLAGRCAIIDLEYQLKFYTDVGVTVSFKVIIGTKPVVEK